MLLPWRGGRRASVAVTIPAPRVFDIPAPRGCQGPPGAEAASIRSSPRAASHSGTSHGVRGADEVTERVGFFFMFFAGRVDRSGTPSGSRGTQPLVIVAEQRRRSRFSLIDVSLAISIVPRGGPCVVSWSALRGEGKESATPRRCCFNVTSALDWLRGWTSGCDEVSVQERRGSSFSPSTRRNTRADQGKRGGVCADFPGGRRGFHPAAWHPI